MMKRTSWQISNLKKEKNEKDLMTQIKGSSDGNFKHYFQWMLPSYELGC